MQVGIRCPYWEVQGPACFDADCKFRLSDSAQSNVFVGGLLNNSRLKHCTEVNPTCRLAFSQ